jgi:hypothetical protein
VGVKGLCLAGPPRSGETSRPNSRDPVASGVKSLVEMFTSMTKHFRHGTS